MSPPEKESPSWQAGAREVSSVGTTGGTITVPGLLTQQEKVHHGWFALSEESFRKIERAYDDMGARRKAKAALTTMHRIANLKGVRTFIVEISSIGKDMDYSYPHAEEGLKLLEHLNLLVIKRRQLPGTKLKAPSEYTICRPIEQNVLSIEPTRNFDECPRIPKNSTKNSSNNNQEREVTFSSIREAVDYFQPLFPEIPVKRSLSRLVAQKGRGFLTKTYIGVWLPNEQERWPAKRQSGTPENYPNPGYVYEDPSQHPDLITSVEALEQLAEFRRTQNRTEETA
jgi:hypothetical protein